MDTETTIAVAALAFTMLSTAAGIVWFLAKIAANVQSLTKQLSDLIVKHDHTMSQLSNHDARLAVLEHDMQSEG